MNDGSAILLRAKTIAIVGISDHPGRDSFSAGIYLQRAGYTIVPVNPMIGSWNGITAYPDLTAVPEPIDIVNVFRRREFVSEIVDQAIAVKAACVWMQSGIVDEESAARAREAGLAVVMDRCIMVEHSRLMRSR